MLSSNASNYVERTLSQSQSQVISKTYRGVEEELIAKVNSFRLKISHVKEKFESLVKEAANTEDCTFTFKELHKTIKYESKENLDKLMKYLSYLSELQHTIPDFFHTPLLNSVFTRNFSSVIDTHKGLLQKNGDNNEKLYRLIPSKNYLGIYLPNIECKDIDSVLCFLILEEFLMLSSHTARLRSDNLLIETNNEEVPQHISIFNPSFNTLVAYFNDKEQHLYLLFLTDVLELMGPESGEHALGSKTEFQEGTKKLKFSKTMGKLEVNKMEVHKKKYENAKTSLPDISLEQAERFVNFLDSDHDHKITFEDVANFAQKHKLVLDSATINEMFEDIFQRRTVVFESQRRNPVDAYEVFHAVRYKYSKDQKNQRWNAGSRKFRDNWLMLFKLLGINLPNHALPAIKSYPLLCNYEVGLSDVKKGTNYMSVKSQATIIKNPKPEILKKQYRPEADIIVQNTQNIMEIYTDEREHAKLEDSNKNAFQTLVNAKFKDITRKTEHRTVEFSTQGYYKESLRLSENPELYLTEKVNPIFKYVPMKKDFVYQGTYEQESIKDTRSAADHTDEVEFDDSAEPYPASKRATMFSIKEVPIKAVKSAQTLKPILSEETQMIYGTKRYPTTLTSSMKERPRSPQDALFHKPIFVTSFKIPDNSTLRTQVAKLEPTIDPYNPPKLHQFRDDAAPENKPPVIITWKKEIPDIIKDPYAQDLRPKDVLERELLEREMYEMQQRGAKKNPNLWIKHFKKAPRERGFVDHKYPDFLEKGDYLDGYVRASTFIRPDVEVPVPFKLVHRSLRKTDKNLTFGDDIPTKI